MTASLVACLCDGRAVVLPRQLHMMCGAGCRAPSLVCAFPLLAFFFRGLCPAASASVAPVGCMRQFAGQSQESLYGALKARQFELPPFPSPRRPYAGFSLSDVGGPFLESLFSYGLPGRFQEFGKHPLSPRVGRATCHPIHLRLSALVGRQHQPRSNFYRRRLLCLRLLPRDQYCPLSAFVHKFSRVPHSHTSLSSSPVSRVCVFRAPPVPSSLHARYSRSLPFPRGLVVAGLRVPRQSPGACDGCGHSSPSFSCAPTHLSSAMACDHSARHGRPQIVSSFLFVELV